MINRQQDRTDDGRIDRAFSRVVDNERGLRIDRLSQAIRHALWATPGEFLARHPIHFPADHPSFGHAARVAQMLMGFNTQDILEVRFVPDVTAEVDTDLQIAVRQSSETLEACPMTVQVLLRTNRWHDTPGVTLGRLCDAWIDARGL